jgi:hypothetical protein
MARWKNAVQTWKRNDQRWQQQKMQPIVQKTKFNKVNY